MSEHKESNFLVGVGAKGRHALAAGHGTDRHSRLGVIACAIALSQAAVVFGLSAAGQGVSTKAVTILRFVVFLILGIGVGFALAALITKRSSPFLAVIGLLLNLALFVGFSWAIVTY